MPLLEVKALVKSYGRRRVVDGVDFEVNAGEVVGLLGPNGAGKTTLLRILATLLRPTAGSLEIGGIDARRDPERVRPLLAMVAHGSHVYEDLTARENLRFWDVMRGGDAAPARLLTALAQVELDGVADERAVYLAMGQASLDGWALEPQTLYVLRPGTAATLRSSSGGRVMLCGGEALPGDLAAQRRARSRI